MVKRIGYLNGIDSVVLTRLSVMGVGTLPFSNGWDDHGKYIAHITPADGISAIIAPFHKIMASPGDPVGPSDVLTSVLESEIPVILVVPKELHGRARKMLSDKNVQFVAPVDLMDALIKLLKIK